MKKTIAVLTSAIILACILMFIPKEKVYTDRLIINCTPTAATRIMSDFQQWKSWWPGEIKNDSTVEYNNNIFVVNNILLNGFYCSAVINKMPVFADIQFLSAPNKQTEFIFSYTVNYASNPFKRLIQFLQNKSLKEVLTRFNNEIKSNLEDVKKVYGFEINEERVPNAIHISIKKIFNNYPSNEDIYNLVDKLKAYANTKGAKTINHPIYNIFSPDDYQYQLMVAIATDRPVPGNNEFLYKEMVRGKIIVGKAVGPNKTINDCLKQVEYFVKDHGRSSPAIQFNRLITDRRTEKDSSKWVTTVNYPVFDRSFF